MNIIPASVAFGATTLTATDTPGIGNLSVNGVSVVDVVSLPGAAQVQVFARGNDADTISFTVPRKFATVALAIEFALLHFRALPRTGNLTFTIGTTSYRMTGAALASVQRGGDMAGRLSLATYTFTGPPFALVTT